MSARDAKKRWLNVVRYYQFGPIFKYMCLTFQLQVTVSFQKKNLMIGPN